ncbi:MAG: OmpA family protein [Bacteroidia bacterium]|nr:OmpA family protein [Bacteroidia bacterium]MDW8159202.1 OmpA family protein [Bacteroidia bacterium]
MLKLALFLFFFLQYVFIQNIQAQIVVYTQFSPQKAVKDIFLGKGIAASNIQGKLASGALGKFVTKSNFLGIDSGIVLTTGQIHNLARPNVYPSITPGSKNQFAGDPDLNKLLANPKAQTLDAAILEFDFQATSDTLRFRYVFASEEYPELALSKVNVDGSPYNDVFGFFLSGPGIDGVVNLAHVPHTQQLVNTKTINRVHNSQYYRSNENSSMPAYTYLDFNGYTTVLVAQYYPLVPCQTYHIKIAIADVGNDETDSAIFLEAKSFSVTPIISLNAIGATQKNEQWCIHEGCHSGYFEIQSLQKNKKPQTFHLKLAGTAKLGHDYILTSIPSKDEEIIITLNPNTLYTRVEIIPLYVAGEQGKRSIVLKLNNNDCTSSIYSDTLWLLDTSPLKLQVEGAEKIEKGKATLLKAQVSGGSGLHSIHWGKNYTGENLKITFYSDTTLVVTVKDKCLKLPETTQKISVHLASPKQEEIPGPPDYLPLTLFFAPGETSIDAGAFPILENLAYFLKKNPQARIKITGYADSKGTNQFNLQLSLKRAQAVANFLYQKGARPQQMLLKGLGEEPQNQPSSPITHSPLSEAERRRVVIEWK